MNNSDKNVLKRYHKELADDIIVDEGLLAGLYTEGVFEKEMNAIIRAHSTPAEKTQKLLELLPKRGPEALSKFVKVIGVTYPWLASLLTNARESVQDQEQQPKSARERGSSSKHTTNSAPAPATLHIDPDIKKIVATFIRRQFGQSVRDTETDKKMVARFLSEQIQGERNRYQPLLCTTREISDLHGGRTPEDIFAGYEVREQLYNLHAKLEPFVIRESPGFVESYVEVVRGDYDGLSDYGNQQDGQVPRLHPEDMTFDLIHKEVDLVLHQNSSQNESVHTSLQCFQESDRVNYPLATLVGQVVDEHHALRDTSVQDRAKIRSLQDEIDLQFDINEGLRGECRKYRKQIQEMCSELESQYAKIDQLEEALAKFQRNVQHQPQQPHKRQPQLKQLEQTTSRQYSYSATASRTKSKIGIPSVLPQQNASNTLLRPGAAAGPHSPRSARTTAGRSNQYQGYNYPDSTYEGIDSSHCERCGNLPGNLG